MPAGSRDARAALARAGATGRRRDRRLRATARLPQQRPAGRDARRGCRHLRRALRRCAGRRDGRLHEQRFRLRRGARTARPRASRSPAIVDVRAEGAGRYMRDRAALAGIEVRSGHVIADTDGDDGARPGSRSSPADGRGRSRSGSTCDAARRVGRLEPRAPAVHLSGRPAPLRRRDRRRSCRPSPVTNVEVVGARQRRRPRRRPHRAALVRPARGWRRRQLAALRRPAARRDARRPARCRRPRACATRSTSSAGRRSAPATTRAGHRRSTRSASSRTLTGRSPRVARADRVPAAGGAGQLLDDGRSLPRRPVRPHSSDAGPSSHVALGALFENVGQWKRAWAYPTAGESFEDAVLRECRAVREGVGMMDVSTLGKIDVQGATPRRFLDRVYTNAFSTLKVGHSALRPDVPGRRHGPRRRHHDAPRRRPLLHDDDDRRRGRRPRLARGMEPDRVARDWTCASSSVTDQWAAVAIAGPRSRERPGHGSRPTSTCRPSRSRS